MENALDSQVPVEYALGSQPSFEDALDNQMSCSKVHCSGRTKTVLSIENVTFSKENLV